MAAPVVKAAFFIWNDVNIHEVQARGSDHRAVHNLFFFLIIGVDFASINYKEILAIVTSPPFTMLVQTVRQNFPDVTLIYPSVGILQPSLK
jgi:hypothetical protein